MWRVYVLTVTLTDMRVLVWLIGLVCAQECGRMVLWSLRFAVAVVVVSARRQTPRRTSIRSDDRSRTATTHG